jgi:aminoglycoside phosphotransferase family enzyme/predicted kinase
MSFVFLTGDYAYKVKKSVNFGYLDYSTLQKRRFFCQQELELNRRLCPEVYLAVVPIAQDKSGLSVAGQGKPVEYAVKMLQLPQNRMMDVLLLQGKVTRNMITAVAERVAAFHRQARQGSAIAAFGDLAIVRQNMSENFRQTERYVGPCLLQSMYERIRDYTDAYMAHNATLFGKRVKEGRIRDCHGDLHAAHVCFTKDICIYDCIEFNDRFRYSDVCSEIAFLAMDLDRSKCFVERYMELSGDTEIRMLLNFYKCYRAYVRGKVESFKLDDPLIPGQERSASLAAARRYFDLACLYTRTAPFLIITVGLMGTGKTTIAKALGQRLGCAVVSSDVTRKKLAGIPATEHRFDEFHSGIYSEDFSRRTYDAILAQAGRVLSRGESVILDASFPRKEERARVREMAEEKRADLLVLECRLGEAEARGRLERRIKEKATSDGRWEIFQLQKESFDAVGEFSVHQHCTLDTSRPIDETIEVIWSRLWK